MKDKSLRFAALAAMVIAMTVCGASSALAAESRTPGDPWEKFNRFAYAVEGDLDRLIFRPASVLFRHIAPGVVGHGVHNLIVNLSEPNAFVNDMLQARFQRAGVSAGRFVTNTTIGVLGLFDVAAGLGLIHHDNEFGVTLGRYGVGPGPYLYLPLIGPTTVRDVFGSGVDALIDPVHWATYANRPEVSTARALVAGLDERVATEAQLNALLSNAADPYATLRSVYLQNKEGEIHGDRPPLQDLPSFDEPAAPSPPQPASAGATPIEEAPPQTAPAAPAPLAAPAAPVPLAAPAAPAPLAAPAAPGAPAVTPAG